MVSIASRSGDGTVGGRSIPTAYQPGMDVARGQCPAAERLCTRRPQSRNDETVTTR